MLVKLVFTGEGELLKENMKAIKLSVGIRLKLEITCIMLNAVSTFLGKLRLKRIAMTKS